MTRTGAESKKQVRPPPDLEILLDLDLAVVVGVQLIQQLVYLLPGDVHVLILKGRERRESNPDLQEFHQHQAAVLFR